MSRSSIGWLHVRVVRVAVPSPAAAHPPLRAGGRPDLLVDQRQRPRRRRQAPARARARAAPRRQPGHAQPGARGARGGRRGGGTPRRRHRGHRTPPDLEPHRRGDPQPRGPAPRDHRDPRRVGDQDRLAGGSAPHRRRPGAHRRRPGLHGRRHRGRRTGRGGRRALPRRRHRSGPLAPPRPVDGRDRRPDQGDPPGVLGQPGRPQDSLAGHRAIAEAIRAGDPARAAEAMHTHVAMVSDVALLREQQ